MDNSRKEDVISKAFKLYAESDINDTYKEALNLSNTITVKILDYFEKEKISKKLGIMVLCQVFANVSSSSATTSINNQALKDLIKEQDPKKVFLHTLESHLSILDLACNVTREHICDLIDSGDFNDDNL